MEIRVWTTKNNWNTGLKSCIQSGSEIRSEGEKNTKVDRINRGTVIQAM
jgi:hypothetical protein